MSKIHEALKRAAGKSGDAAGDVPSGGSAVDAVDPTGQAAGPAAQLPHTSAGKLKENLQGTIDPPPLPFNKLRAYRLEVHHHVVIIHQPKSLAAEQFRTLRTRIQNLPSDSRHSILLVTSPGPGEGKTLVSVNLAMSLAQEVDAKVLLVGCDLRRPSIHRFLGLEDGQQPGLSEHLNGHVSLEKAIWRFGGTSLHVLTAGSMPDNPSELLGSRRMERTMAYLAGQFDYVVLDAPPLNPVADPAILIPLVDGVLMVVRYGQTGNASLNKALETFPEDKVLGFVFNAAELRFSGYYYSYEYSDESSEQ